MRRRASAEALPRELTLEQLIILAEFEGDSDAVEKLVDAARWHGALDHRAERLRQDRAASVEHERLRPELEAPGSPSLMRCHGGQRWLRCCHEAEDLTPEAHANCPGRGVFFRSYDPTAPVHYCTDPAAHGHMSPVLLRLLPGLRLRERRARTKAGPARLSTARLTPPVALVIQGNKAWKAAGEVRKRWLAAHCSPAAPHHARPHSS